jgi:hypothetical protein
MLGAVFVTQRQPHPGFNVIRDKPAKPSVGLDHGTRKDVEQIETVWNTGHLSLTFVEKHSVTTEKRSVTAHFSL